MSEPIFNQNDPRQLFLGFTRSFEPIIGADGFEVIELSTADVYTLTPPADAVACALSIEANALSTAGVPCVRYKFGVDPNGVEGNPFYDAMYYEIVSVEGMNELRMRRAEVLTMKVSVQYFKTVLTK